MKKNLYIAMFCLCSSFTFASDIQKAVDVTQKANKNSITSQKKIDKLVTKKERLYQEFRNLEYELKSLNNYNKELKEIINSQNEEKRSIISQIEQIDKTKREILPLIKNMLLSLEEMIQNDTPFLYQERTNRMERLKRLIKRSDVSVAAKYRAVIEAYEIELEYTRTIESYNDILRDEGLSKNVKFLRIGRMALYYVTEDNQECALWDNTQKIWVKLDSSFTVKLNKAIKIASKKGVPSLLKLPMFSATEVM